MKRKYFAMTALIIMTVLNVGNAHSGSGTFGESLSGSSVAVATHHMLGRTAEF